MWARLESNTIKEILRRPKALIVGGVQYPSNIFSMWTEAELVTIGIVPITVDNNNFKNQIIIINDDILKVDESWVFDEKTIVFGNIPYNI